MVLFGSSPLKRSGRVAPKSTPVSGSIAQSRTGSAILPGANRLARRRPAPIGSAAAAKRTTAGALTSLGGRLAGSTSLGLLNTGSDRGMFLHSQSLIADQKAQATALRRPPVPPPRPLRRATALSALQAASATTAGLAAKVSTAATAGAAAAAAVPLAQSLSPTSVLKKSSLSKRALSGGKAVDPSNQTQTKRRVKFSAHVSTHPTETNTKKAARIGELQLKKRVKKLKRTRSRKEGGTGGIGLSPNTSDITQHGTIVDVEALKSTPPPPTRVLRLNVVGKSSPATGKSALAAALRRKAQRSKDPALVPEKSSTKTKTKTKTKAKAIGSKACGCCKTVQTALASSSHSVGSTAGLKSRKKTLSAAGPQRRTPQPLHGRRSPKV